MSIVNGIEVEGLVKSHGLVKSVRGVSFVARPGEIVGLLGPNGAGKTTTVECAVGLREADAGTVRLAGLDSKTHGREMKKYVGVALQSTALPDKITATEALRLFGGFYDKARPGAELLERFGLTEKAGAGFETLSQGQKQRLAVALALINDPSVIFLDEPTAGLDPQSRRKLHDVMLEEKRAGKAILLTTHHIDEAQLLCDRIYIIDHGEIIASGTPGELMAGAKGIARVKARMGRLPDVQRLRDIAFVEEVKVDGDEVELKTRLPGKTVLGLVHLIEEDAGNELIDLHIHKPSLEDVFIEMTGRGLRD